MTEEHICGGNRDPTEIEGKIQAEEEEDEERDEEDVDVDTAVNATNQKLKGVIDSRANQTQAQGRIEGGEVPIPSVVLGEASVMENKIQEVTTAVNPRQLVMQEVSDFVQNLVPQQTTVQEVSPTVPPLGTITVESQEADPYLEEQVSEEGEKSDTEEDPIDQMAALSCAPRALQTRREVAAKRR
ncbi:hypothetical protein U1Q18_031282 [Sarracenia purpurea var. burkii]